MKSMKWNKIFLSGSCVNSNGDTKDVNGYDCNFYQYSPQQCGHKDTAEFIANEMCCVCGGGYTDGNVGNSLIEIIRTFFFFLLLCYFFNKYILI